MRIPEIMLLSIKPNFAELILDGSKKYEFRKTGVKDGVRIMLLYASSPRKQFVGYAEISDVLEESPTKLWDMTREYAGINREGFRAYFKGKKYAYAYKIAKVQKFKHGVDPKSVFSNFIPPQSFRYIDYESVQRVLNEAC